MIHKKAIEGEIKRVAPSRKDKTRSSPRETVKKDSKATEPIKPEHKGKG